MRPKIKIQYTSLDWMAESIAAIGMILMLALLFYYYNNLPEQVPIHYNFNGEPDSFKERESIWGLAAVGFGLYLGLTILQRFPHIFNYPVQITMENAHRQYRMAVRLLRTLKVFILWGFAYIVYATIRTALNWQDGLGRYFVVELLVLIFAVVAIYIYRSVRRV